MGFKLSKIFDFFKDKTPEPVKKGKALLEELRRPAQDNYFGAALNKPFPEKVKNLIASGADLTVTNFAGESALCLAISNKGLEGIAQEIIEAGADVNHITTMGQTPLMLAAENNLSTLVKSLLEKKANAGLANQDGDTALHSACKAGNAQIVERLLAAGADIDKQGKWGQTPLMTATEYGSFDVVKILVDAGARRDLKNENDRTVYDIAHMSGDGYGSYHGGKQQIRAYLEKLEEQDKAAAIQARVAQKVTEQEQMNDYLKEGAPLNEKVKPVPSIKFKPKEPKKP